MTEAASYYKSAVANKSVGNSYRHKYASTRPKLYNYKKAIV